MEKDNARVIVNSNIHLLLVKEIKVICAQPTVGKTYFTRNHSDFQTRFIDFDDILHLAKMSVYNNSGIKLSGWDILDHICLECEMHDHDFNLYQFNTKNGVSNELLFDLYDADNYDKNEYAFYLNLMQTTFRCEFEIIMDSIIAKDTQIIIFTHHPRLVVLITDWIEDYLSDMGSSFYNDPYHFDSLLMAPQFFIREFSDYKFNWNKRNENVKEAKNKSFNEQELLIAYDQWILSFIYNFGDMSDYYSFINSTAREIANKFILLSYSLGIDRVFKLQHNEYLSDVAFTTDKYKYNEFMIDTLYHKLQILSYFNTFTQKLYHNCFMHDNDKLMYTDLSDWKANGFPLHMSTRAEFTSHHHKENLEDISSVVELLFDWLSACQRHGDHPSKLVTQSSPTIDFDALFKNEVLSILSLFNNDDLNLCLSIINPRKLDELYENFKKAPSFNEDELNTNGTNASAIVKEVMRTLVTTVDEDHS